MQDVVIRMPSPRAFGLKLDCAVLLALLFLFPSPQREMLVEAGGVAKSNRDSKSVELGGEADEGEEGKQSVYLLGRQTLKERTTATHQTQLMDSTDLLLSVQSPASARCVCVCLLGSGVIACLRPHLSASLHIAAIGASGSLLRRMLARCARAT